MAVRKPGPKESPAQDKLDALGVAEIARRIADGQTYRSIAAEVGVGLGRLCEWMDADPERAQACARARETSAQAFEERAEEEIIAASDQFELAKAKELAIHWRWRAKAVNPRRYGEKVAVGGAEDLPPVKTLPDDALLARIEALRAKVEGK